MEIVTAYSEIREIILGTRIVRLKLEDLYLVIIYNAPRKLLFGYVIPYSELSNFKLSKLKKYFISENKLLFKPFHDLKAFLYSFKSLIYSYNLYNYYTKVFKVESTLNAQADTGQSRKCKLETFL